VGVTLPTTGAFRSAGRLAKQGGTWSVVVDDATVGTSRLRGAFVYETRATRAVPRLAGRLAGTRLLLADLGPAIGGAAPAASGASAPTAPTRTRGAGKLLPSRPFDLASLRRMDAAIAIDIAEVDLNTPRLAPLRPLRATLSLDGGVLALDDLDARSAGGRLQGRIALDGRGAVALWRTDLRWDGLQLAQWLRLPRAGSAPPWIAGRLDGRAALQGRGLSTADFLATLAGDVRARLQDGAVSHLAVEAAGIDLAQALGMWIKGDDLLPVQCALVDLAAEAGVLRPRVAVLDTRDSAVWADGTLSLATETVALRVVVVPRDFSPLALRAPLHLDGPLGAPRVSLDKAPLARRLGGALLLGLLNPLAALLPLIDLGDDAAATRGAAGCRALAQRLPAARVTAAEGGDRTRR